MLKKLHILALGFAAMVMVFVVAANVSTPFRGEHWSVVYAYSQAEGLDKFRNIFNFTCFGVLRFQWFTFFVLAFSYALFGLTFALHLICGGLLHVAYTFVFLRFLSLGEPQAPKGIRALFFRYPLEAALFLVLFFAADVVTWNFFLYLQLACLVSYAAAVRFFEGRATDVQVAPFAMIALATLLYEPFLLFVPGFLLVSRRKKEWVIGVGTLMLLAVLLYWRYTQYWNELPNWSGGTPPPILTVPPIQKAVFAVAKYLGAVAVFFYRTFVPLTAAESNIYEVAIPGWFSILGLPILAGIAALGALYSRHRRDLSRFVLIAGTSVFLVIAWPRTENSLYLLKQFRYFYVLAGLWIPLLLWRLRDAIGPRLYHGLLIGLIVLHGLRTMEHAYRVRSAMRPLGQYVAMEKSLGLGSDAIVSNVADVLREKTLPTPKRHFPLIYNASTCLGEWHEKLKK